jgi:hypothetical protein
VSTAGVVLGLVAGFSAWFLLPPTGLFGSPKSSGDRDAGALGGLAAAVGAPAGLWAAAILRRSRAAGWAAAVIGVGILVVAATYAGSAP